MHLYATVFTKLSPIRFDVYFDIMKSSVLVTEQPRNLGNQSDDQRRATVPSLDVNLKKKKEKVAAIDEAPFSPIL